MDTKFFIMVFGLLLNCFLSNATDSASSEDLFLNAISRDDIEEVRSIIARYEQFSLNQLINCKNWLGETPLGCASRLGYLEMVGLLLNNEARVDEVSLEKMPEPKKTPLSWAALNGHICVVERLLARGASFNMNNEDETPIYHAACEGHVDIVERLLSAGAHIDLENKGDTPIYNVVAYFVIKRIIEKGTIEKKDVDKFRFLLLHGPDLCYKDDQGKTTMDFILSVPALFQVFIDCTEEKRDQTEKK